jgi:energy-coupling factor transporter transmembrane protein EcfT
MESLATLGLGVFAVYFISFVFSLGILWLMVRVARHAWAWNGSTLTVLLSVVGLLTAILFVVLAFWSRDHKEKAEKTAVTISETAPDTLPANFDFNKEHCWTKPANSGYQFDQNLDMKAFPNRTCYPAQPRNVWKFTVYDDRAEVATYIHADRENTKVCHGTAISGANPKALSKTGCEQVWASQFTDKVYPSCDESTAWASAACVVETEHSIAVVFREEGNNHYRIVYFK